MIFLGGGVVEEWGVVGGGVWLNEGVWVVRERVWLGRGAI